LDAVKLLDHGTLPAWEGVTFAVAGGVLGKVRVRAYLAGAGPLAASVPAASMPPVSILVPSISLIASAWWFWPVSIIRFIVLACSSLLRSLVGSLVIFGSSARRMASEQPSRPIPAAPDAINASPCLQRSAI